MLGTREMIPAIRIMEMPLPTPNSLHCSPILVIYRIGSAIPVPYVDTQLLNQYLDGMGTTILGLYNVMSLMISRGLAKMLLKPRLGTRRARGIWPPSNPTVG